MKWHKKDLKDKKRLAISDDHVVYISQLEFDLGIDEDPFLYSQTIESVNFSKLLDAMKKNLNQKITIKFGILQNYLKVVKESV